MKNRLKLILIFFWGAVVTVLAQEKEGILLVNPGLDAKSNAYIDRQDEAFLKEISNTLKLYPPQYPTPKERKPALFLLDAVLHDQFAAERKPVQHFYRKRMENVLTEIENTKIEKGAKIWKLYNMGFIVKTRTVTLAFDLVRGTTAGSKNFTMAMETMNRLVKQCDVLFISHWHSDHIDKKVAQTFIDQGKPIIATPQLWKEDPIYNKITHLERDANTIHTLPVKNGMANLKVIIYPGHQMSKTMNNVPLVFTPEGISVSHMGDQINEGDFMVDYDWIDTIAKHHKVDILLPPCWTNELFRIVKGFNPALVIPGHENELGHPVDDRVPFWGDTDYLKLTNDELFKSNYPVIQMIWGESYHYFQTKK